MFHHAIRCSKMRERVTIWFLGIRRPRRQRRTTETEGDAKKNVALPTRQTSNWRIAESFALRNLDMCVAEICKPVVYVQLLLFNNIST